MHPVRLAWPGDLLHEAGHVAVGDPLSPDAAGRPTIPARRWRPSPGPAPRRWNWASRRTSSFHAGGYRGGAKALIENFAEGGYVGVPMLAMWGLTCEPHRAKAMGEPGYPHMLAWRRT